MGIILEAKDICWSNNTNTFHLENINISLNNSSINIMLGKNGSGKSVLAKILSGLLKPKSGDVFINNSNIRNTKNLPENIFYIGQYAELSIIGDTVIEDLEFGLQNFRKTDTEKSEIIESTIKLCQLDQYKNSFTDEISAGIARRLSIASALVIEPKILILDEPLNNLDYEGKLRIIEIINNLKSKGKTMLIITHEAYRFINSIDSMFILNSGNITTYTNIAEAKKFHFENNGIENPFYFYDKH